MFWDIAAAANYVYRPSIGSHSFIVITGVTPSNWTPQSLWNPPWLTKCNTLLGYCILVLHLLLVEFFCVLKYHS